MAIHLLKVHHDIGKKPQPGQIENFGEKEAETAVHEEE